MEDEITDSERNPTMYQGKNLRGKRFTDENFAGYDFSHTDLRGTQFKRCSLHGANFSYARLGTHYITTLIKHLIALIVSAYLSRSSIMFNTLVIDEWHRNPFTILFCVLTIIGLLEMIVQWGYNQRTILAGAGVFVGAGTISNMIIGAGAGSFVVAVIGAVAGAGTSVVAFAGTFTGAFAGTIMGVGSFAYEFNSHEIAFGITVQVAWFIVTWWLMKKRDVRSDQLYAARAWWEVVRGSRFIACDLTDADFSSADCRGGNFRRAKSLRRTRWFEAKHLDRARFPKGYLPSHAMKELVTTCRAERQTFDGDNLSGLNLAGGSFQGCSFFDAQLNHADLQHADLTDCNLTRTQLENTTLRGAMLTGAFIEDWNITRSTDLTDVQCDYIFMHYPRTPNEDNLRKPDDHNQTFGEGDFAAFIKPLYDTLDLYHSDNVDPRAIAVSINQLQTEHPDADLEIVSIERRGDSGIVTRVAVSPDTNKSDISAQYYDMYHQYKALAEPKIAALEAQVAEKADRIQSQERMITTLLEKETVRYGDVHVEDGGVMVGRDVGGGIIVEDQDKTDKS